MESVKYPEYIRKFIRMNSKTLEKIFNYDLEYIKNQIFNTDDEDRIKEKIAFAKYLRDWVDLLLKTEIEERKSFSKSSKEKKFTGI